jgi:hypothetical protein
VFWAQVHSLHHRNTDVEPFAGLAMHPVEHLYYYACILPSLVCLASPFHFVWNGIHMLLAPAASHSGWEDHFQVRGARACTFASSNFVKHDFSVPKSARLCDIRPTVSTTFTIATLK